MGNAGYPLYSIGHYTVIVPSWQHWPPPIPKPPPPPIIHPPIPSPPESTIPSPQTWPPTMDGSSRHTSTSSGASRPFRVQSFRLKRRQSRDFRFMGPEPARQGSMGHGSEGAEYSSGGCGRGRIWRDRNRKRFIPSGKFWDGLSLGWRIVPPTTCAMPRNRFGGHFRRRRGIWVWIESADNAGPE
jgi:hypothetical protein